MFEWGLAFIYKGNTTVQSSLVKFAIKLYFSAFWLFSHVITVVLAKTLRILKKAAKIQISESGVSTSTETSQLHVTAILYIAIIITNKFGLVQVKN